MIHRYPPIAALLLVGLLAACEADEPHLDAPPPDDTPPIGAADPERPDLIDPAVRVQLADDLDESAAELRRHITAIRIIAPDHFLREFELHRSRVEGFIDSLDAALATAREHASDDAAEALGLQRGRHRALADETSEVRRELDRLERLTPEEVTRDLPAHFERLRRLAATGETIAAHLRRS